MTAARRTEVLRELREIALRVREMQGEAAAVRRALA